MKLYIFIKASHRYLWGFPRKQDIKMRDLSIHTGYFPSLLCFPRKRWNKQLDLYSEVSSLTTIRAPDYEITGWKWLAKVSISCQSTMWKTANLRLKVIHMRTLWNSHVDFVWHISVSAYCKLVTLRSQHAIISEFTRCCVLNCCCYSVLQISMIILMWNMSLSSRRHRHLALLAPWQ